MITKKTFCEVIENLRRKQEFENKVSDLFSEYSDVITDGMLPVQLIDCDLVRVIEEAMDLPIDKLSGSTLSWWIWECEFGKKYKEGDFELTHLPEGHKYRNPDLSTPEKLYDYLVFEAEENTKKGDS